MISICPYCGKFLDKPLTDGITTCTNCTRVFDTSPINYLLCASWYVRKNNLISVDGILEQFKLSDNHFELVKRYVVELGYSHDEFLKIINKEI